MNNARKPLQTSIPAIDDIPVAMRDTPKLKPQSPPGSIWLMLGLVGLVLALSVGLLFALAETQSMASRRLPSDEDSELKVAPQPTSTPTPASDALLGHFPYQEAPAAELQPITPDGSIKLRKAAAEAFKAMQAAALAEGVHIVPISGFRSLTEQNYLFFDVKASRGEVTTKRAEVSAPPGYSEHHTGYAVDIGDGNVPSTNLSIDFEKTEAFKWMEANAAHFSFELSFPRDNPQGISYEPWHWRFVGDIHSLETFYKVRGKK
ncbi:MAG: D-alanyl-D-alanine carboxypeptidase family protein [Oscillatoriaceae bacterium SKW80]|nr:D-alanyl-D-alanine carboxypeptidase family protein [Oscillatoriaceae bacterium SKYG93]MCX8122426.1 D-alanyl-D-alanine carboxypeptidase family protein [Oscillatoriaceae bacterium SKW80]MDW8452649.1 D-alanyl-D-alanine carboxypeptidase family protein [Oscillatoriaceae cyanobacterium SKYGB_i_bin93]